MSGPSVKQQRRADDPIPRGVLVDVIERLKNEERKNCDQFCALNSGEANDVRRHDSTLILSALNTVLFELGALNG